MRSVDEALGHTPNDPYLLYLKAEILHRQEKSKDALNIIDAALSREPNFGGYHHLHSKILNDLSRYVDAKRSIDTALSLEPNDPDILCTLALVTYYLDNTIIACEIIDAVLSLHPHHTHALSLKSQICSSTLTVKNNLLRRILSADPFHEVSYQEHRNIRRYYQIAPMLMGMYLIYAIGAKAAWWGEKEFASTILLILSFYLWRDWRLSIPFFGVVFVLLGEVTVKDWYIVPIAAVIYYAMGRITGTLVIIIYNKINDTVRKGWRWMSR
jgi:tetratricopeptide (TPR) repeat protein